MTDEELRELPTGPSDPSSRDAVREFEEKYDHHPCFCWTANGGRLVRARWPAYPSYVSDLASSMLILSEFPKGMTFFPIAVKDAAVLYVAGKIQASDLLSPRLHHVALWQTLVDDAATNGFLRLEVTPRDYASLVVGPCVSATDRGRNFAYFEELVKDRRTELVDHVREFMVSGSFDVAIREAGVYLESVLRTISGAPQRVYGSQLVDYVFQNTLALRSPRLRPRPLGDLHARLRRFFSFVRNVYAHNLHEVDFVEAHRAIRSCDGMVDTLEGWCGRVRFYASTDAS
jgi:hypothetical protein